MISQTLITFLNKDFQFSPLRLPQFKILKRMTKQVFTHLKEWSKKLRSNNGVMVNL